LRIDVDEQLEKELNQIKNTTWIRGRGHTETVRYLVRFYQQNKKIEKIIEEKMGSIQETLENSIMASFRKIIQNLLQ
jgi:hypothetical protein